MYGKIADYLSAILKTSVRCVQVTTQTYQDPVYCVPSLGSEIIECTGFTSVTMTFTAHINSDIRSKLCEIEQDCRWFRIVNLHYVDHPHLDAYHDCNFVLITNDIEKCAETLKDFDWNCFSSRFDKDVDDILS